MSSSDYSEDFQELREIEQDITEIELDLRSNVNSILIRPDDMRAKIESLQMLINQNDQKLQFLRKSSTNPLAEFFKRIKEIEKRVTVLKNQIEINLKAFKKA